MCDTFPLSNITSEVTCVKSSVGSSIEVMLTKRPRSFHHTSVIETGTKEFKKGIIYNSQDKECDLFSDISRTILGVRGNQAKFMMKEVSKSIMNKSRFKNRYLKWPSRENFLAYKKGKNFCDSLSKKANKTYFEKATENRIMESKKFWSTVKPFLSSKGFIHNNDITVEIDNKIIEDKSELA